MHRPERAPDWLTARPIAHRGLHGNGIAENSLAAAEQAIGRAYAIECDVQSTRDGEAVVFHDVGLDRVTFAEGNIGELTAAEAMRLCFRDGPGTIARLSDFLAAIGGRVPVFVEVKSRFDGDERLAARIARLAYCGPMAIMSFDPGVLAQCRALGLACPLGLVAQANNSEDKEDKEMPPRPLDLGAASPDFLAWCAPDFPHPLPQNCDVPLLAWTLRDATSCSRARIWADQVIFEGFDPDADCR